MKTGLFFGSFNPVHIGHMAIANYLVEFSDLEQIWFVVSPQNPFKEKKTLLNERHRLQLVREAIGDDRRFKASAVEFKLPRPSYTINTLAHLKEKHPGHEFALIIGSDNLETFPGWKNYQEILNYHLLYVYPRVGEKKTVPGIEKCVRRFDAPVMEISSTFIREAIRNKKDMRHFLPEKVFNYIREMHFYEK